MNLVEEAQETSDEMISGACSLVSARYATLGMGVLQPKSFALAVHSNNKNKLPTPTPLTQPRNWN